MMVIQVQNVSGGSVTIAGVDIPDGGNALFPADRCAWQFSYSQANTEYEIDSAVFFTGNLATGVPLVDTGRSAHLGYIGKSGRFVPITS